MSQPGPGGQPFPYHQQPPPGPPAPPGPPPTWPDPYQQQHPAPWAPPGGATPPPSAQREDRSTAVLSYLGMLLASLVVPLIFYCLKRHESPFLRHHAAQAMNLALTGLGYLLVGGLFVIPVPFLDTQGGVLADVAVGFVVLVYTIWGVNMITMLVYLVVGAVKASNGQLYRIPGWRCWRMIR